MNVAHILNNEAEILIVKLSLEEKKNQPSYLQLSSKCSWETERESDGDKERKGLKRVPFSKVIYHIIILKSLLYIMFQYPSLSSNELP